MSVEVEKLKKGQWILIEYKDTALGAFKFLGNKPRHVLIESEGEEVVVLKKWIAKISRYRRRP